MTRDPGQILNARRIALRNLAKRLHAVRAERRRLREALWEIKWASHEGDMRRIAAETLQGKK